MPFPTSWTWYVMVIAVASFSVSADARSGDRRASSTDSDSMPPRGGTATGLPRTRPRLFPGLSVPGKIPVTRELAVEGPDASIYGRSLATYSTIYAAFGNGHLNNEVRTGDLNGDGFGDLVFHSEIADPEGVSWRNGSGTVYVYFGPLARSTVRDVQLGPADVTIYGADDDLLGIGIGIGDVSADGVDDLIISAGAASRTPVDIGRIYVFLGPLTQDSVIDLEYASPDVMIVGESPGDSLGQSCAVGDVDGDGIDDIVLGAPRHHALHGVRAFAGQIYGILGPVVAGTVIDLGSTPAGVEIHGIDPYDWLGSDVVIGDMNADGHADIVAGAWTAAGPGNSRPYAGDVYILFGPFPAGTRRDLAVSEADVTVYGEHSTYYPSSLGTAMAVGDVTGDGVDDLIVRDALTHFYDYTIYGLFGPFATGTKVDLAVDPVDVKVRDSSLSTQLGSAMAIGDISGDGTGDLLLGVPYADIPWPCLGCGKVFGLFGPLLRGTDVDVFTTPADLTIIGPRFRAVIGEVMAFGELSGDGQPDFIVGGSLGCRLEGDEGCGGVFVLFGPSSSGSDEDEDGDETADEDGDCLRAPR